MSGRTLVLTGTGKGKSSSALGMVFRAAGWNKRVCVIQFIKGARPTGEQRAAERFDNIDWHALGEGFTWDTNNPAQDRDSARQTWDFCQKVVTQGAYDLVLLDEINYAIGYGWLTGEEVATFIRSEKPPEMHLILTGRGAPQELLDVSDTATDMKAIKHGFDRGIRASLGIEY